MRTLLFVAPLLLAACVSPIDRHVADCTRMGYVQGGQAHAGCVERRQAAEDAYWRGYAQQVIDRRQRRAQQPVVRCTSTQVGYQVFTTCR